MVATENGSDLSSPLFRIKPEDAQIVRYIISCMLILTCAIVLLAGVVLGDENIMPGDQPATETVLLLLGWFWLAGNEISQVAIVLSEDMEPPEDMKKAQYCKELIFPKLSTPTTVRPDRKSHLFLGQTFQVVGCTFLVAQILTFHHLTFCSWLSGLAATGLMGVMITAPLFQLFPSTTATSLPMLMLEIYPAIDVMIRISLLIEASGIANVVYVILHLIKAGNEADAFMTTTNDKIKTGLSCMILAATGCYAIIYASMGALNIVGGLLLLCLLGGIFVLEGLKVAVLQLRQMSATVADSLGIDYELQSILEEDGLDRFLVGRQMLVVPLGFSIAHLCSNAATFPAIFVTATAAQLLPQVLAGRKPELFLTNKAAAGIVTVCHWVEKIGIAEVALALKRFTVYLLVDNGIATGGVKVNEEIYYEKGADEDDFAYLKRTEMLVAKGGGSVEI